jgi:hypothetical protein
MKRMSIALQPGGYRYLVVPNDDGWDQEVATVYLRDYAEHARRITACWNACMGLSTETLERIASRRDFS